MVRERWTMISGYRLYQVSTHGRVRNIRRNQLLKFFNNKGYLRVGLCKDGSQKKLLVHRLVLENFIGPSSDNRPQTRHLDGNKHNNRLDNLRWGNNQENQIDCLEHGRRQTRLKTSDISLIRQLLQHHSCSQVARIFDVSPKTINDIKLRKTWCHV